MPLLEEPSRSQRPDALGGERHALLARLRDEIRRIEHRPGRRDGAVASGLTGVDLALPGGGFPRGAIAELCGGPASGKTAVALSVLAALPAEDLYAWVDARGELYPPAAAARGVELARLLVVRPPLSPEGGAPPGGPSPWRSALWAAEALLSSSAFAAVVVDVALPRAVPGADAAARRLQAAAERGGAVGLWLSPPASTPAGLRIPAAVRLEVSSDGGRIVARRAAATGAWRAQGQADERAPAPQGAPDAERGFAAGADLERAGGSGGRGLRGPEALRSECPPAARVRGGGRAA